MRKDSGNRKRSSLAQVLGGDMLGSHFVLKQIPLLLLILAFCLLMVAIRYRVASLNKQKDRMKQEVSYLLDTVGVGLVAGPPFELRTDK